MHKPTARTICSTSPEHTCAIAQKLGAELRAGDVLLLSGDIGAGKTHFARCLIQSLLPIPEDVPSPTYTLVQTYPGISGEIWHADLYRLSHPNDVFELGLTEAFESAICLIEWPDRLGDLAPQTALEITLTPCDTPQGRSIFFSSDSGEWDRRLAVAFNS